MAQGSGSPEAKSCRMRLRGLIVDLGRVRRKWLVRDKVSSDALSPTVESTGNFLTGQVMLERATQVVKKDGFDYINQYTW